MGRHLDVLVVDDQPGVRQLLGMIISELGDRVREAQNGRDAVDMIKKCKPSLVIMDIRMPVMGGVEALQEIKNIYSELPVIMMSAHSSEEVLESLREKGALMCLTKPFDVNFIQDLLNGFREI